MPGSGDSGGSFSLTAISSYEDATVERAAAATAGPSLPWRDCPVRRRSRITLWRTAARCPAQRTVESDPPGRRSCSPLNQVVGSNRRHSPWLRSAIVLLPGQAHATYGTDPNRGQTNDSQRYRKSPVSVRAAWWSRVAQSRRNKRSVREARSLSGSHPALALPGATAPERFPSFDR